MSLDEYLSRVKSFEFYVIDLLEYKAQKNEILSLFNDALKNAIIIEKENYSLVVCEASNIDSISLINAINDDFGISLKVFKSNKINANNKNYIDILIKEYFEVSYKIKRSFTNIKMLVKDLIHFKKEDLSIVKPIILSGLLNDSKLVEVANGMFLNNLNVCKTASYVYMHRNTINNKLALIYQETGFDIQNFEDAVVMYLLLNE